MASYTTYNFPTLISGSYYAGSLFTLYADINRTTNVDLTGCHIAFSLKNITTPTVIAKQFTTVDGSISITNATGGVFQVVGQNMNLADGTYQYDMVFKFPNGENKVYLKGQWVIIPKIT
jgi:hypothetical protein